MLGPRKRLRHLAKFTNTLKRDQRFGIVRRALEYIFRAWHPAVIAFQPG